MGDYSLSERQFFALIRLALGGPVDNCLMVCRIDWEKIYQLAEQHTLKGICFQGIQRLPKDRLPNMVLLMDWAGQVEIIRTLNREVCQRAVEVSERLKAEGLEPVLLKGQGIAQLYPDPSIRMSGDIDIWVKGDRKEILSYLRATSNSKYMVYHNAEYPIYEDTSVEVHFTPSWFWNFRRNRRFQQFCEDCREECLANKVELIPGGSVCVPTTRMNLVFVLQHIYRHLFGEGIGLRQVVDYYFVLQSNNQISDNRLVISDEAGAVRNEAMGTIESLGMKRFCAAVMWIMKEVLGLADEALLCEPNEKEGRFLLNEIMMAGNFGHYDERNKHRVGESAMSRFCNHVRRDMRFIRSYPGEVLALPVWKVWHYLWRRRYVG